MGNRSKRFIVLLLSALMVISQMSPVVFAAAEDSGPAGQPEGVVTDQTVDEDNDTTGKDEEKQKEEGQKEDTVSEENVVVKNDAPEKVEAPAEKTGSLKAANDAAAAEDPVQGLVVKGVITVNNTTQSDIVLYGLDKGNTGYWTVAAGKSLDIGLASFYKIYASESIEITNPSKTLDYSVKASDKAGYKYCIEFESQTVNSALSFNVVSDDNYWLVTFMPNGGDNSMEPQRIAKGSSAKLTENAFTKAGYEFKGWSTDKDATTAEYADGADFEPTGDVKLYAIWSHKHNWSVVPSGSKVTVKCISSGCLYETNKEYTATLNVDDSTFEASVSKDEGFPDEISISEPVYKQGGNVVEPVKPGTYKAVSTVSVDGYSADIEKTFTIEKAMAEVTKAPVGKSGLVYTGEKQDLLAEAGEAAGGQLVYSLSKDGEYGAIANARAKNANEHTVWYKVEGDEDHIDSLPQSITVSIAQKDVYLKWDESSLKVAEYDGQNHIPSVAVVDKDGKEVSGVAAVVGSYKNAGEYDVKATLKNNNFRIKGDDTAKMTIGKKRLTATWSSKTHNYTGKSYQPQITELNGVLHDESCNVTGYTIYPENDPDNAVDEAVNAGNYVIRAELDNSNYYVADYTFSIKKVDAEYQKVTAKTGLVYNGEQQALVNAGSTEHGTILYSVDKGDFSEDIPTAKDAGSHTVDIKLVGDVNHLDKTGSLKVNIGKRGLKVKADDKVKGLNAEDPDLTYSVVEGLAESDSADEVLSGELTREPGENAGGYYIRQGTLAANDNYDLTFADGILTISKGISIVTKTPKAISGLVYSGVQQDLIEEGEVKGGTLFYYKGAEPDSDKAEWKTTVPKGTNAGSFDVWYKVKGDSNHGDVPPQKIAGVAISQKEVYLKWDESSLNVETYDGQNHSPSVAVVDKDGKEVSGVAADVGSYKNAGEYDVKATLNNNNFRIKGDDTAQMTIGQRELTATWDRTGYEYDGKAHQPTIQSLTGLIGNDTCNVDSYDLYRLDEEGRYEEEINEAVMVGSYAADPVLDNDNYFVKDRVYSITKTKPGYIAPAAKTDLIYNGKPQALVNGGSTDDGVIAYSVNGGEYSEDIPTATDAGTYQVSVLVSGDGNHTDVQGVLPVTIGKAEPELSVSIEDWTYGDPANEPSVKGNPGKGKVSFTYKAEESEEYTTDVPENAGSYTVKASVEETKNYQAKEVTADFKISKAEPVLTKAPAAVRGLVFNGKPQDVLISGKADGGRLLYAYNKSDLYNEKAHTANDLTLKGSATETSSSAVWYMVKGDANHSDLEPVSVSCTVEKLVVTPPVGANLTYNGDAQALLTAPAAVNSRDKNVKVFYQVKAGGVETDAIPQAVGDKASATTYVVEYWVRNTSIEGDEKDLTARESVTANILPVSVTAPEDLNMTYTGEELPLIKAGSSDLGTMQYRKGTSGDFSEEIPSGIEAGSYTVQYRVVNGDKTVVDPVTMQAHIEKATLDDAAVSIEGWTYGDKANDPEVTGLPEGKGIPAPVFKYSGRNNYDQEYEESGEAPEDAGDYTVTACIGESTNYHGAEVSDTFTIAKAPLDRNHLPLAKKNLVYNGEPQELVDESMLLDGYNKVMYKTSLTGEWKENVKGTDAGSYTVWYFIDGGNNYESSSMVERLIPDFTVTISKADIKPSVKISGWEYGKYDPKKRGPVVEGVPEYYEGSVDLQYAVYDPETDAYVDFEGEDVPVDAGKYLVKATLSGDKNYNEAESPDALFEIRKAGFESAVEIKGWTYGEYDEEVNSPSVTGNPEDMDVEYWYCPCDKDGNPIGAEEYTQEVPEDAGYYVVHAVIAEGENHVKVTTENVKFTVEKATAEPAVRILGWSYKHYNERLNTPWLVRMPRDNNGEVTYSYAKYDNEKKEVVGEYNAEPPKDGEAGYYAVKANISGADNYKDAETEPYVFEIRKAQPEGSRPVARTDLEYKETSDGAGNMKPADQELVEPGVSEEGTHYVYYVSRTRLDLSVLNGKNFKTEIPTGNVAGDYYVWYKLKGSGSIADSAVKGPIHVEIAKSAPEYEISKAEGLVYDGEDHELVTVTTNDGVVEYAHERRGIFGYTRTTYSETVPAGKDAGDYTVTFRIRGDANHTNIAEQSVSVSIAKAEIKPEIQISRIIPYLTAPLAKPSIKEGTNPGNGKVTYHYTGMEFGKGSYVSDDMPFNAGIYHVVAAVEETKNYQAGTADDSFIIVPLPVIKTAPKAKELTYTGEAQELVTAGKNLIGTAEYKLDSGSYTTEIPKATDAGTYKVSYRVNTESNPNFTDYNPGVEVEVTIKKASIDPEVSIDDWTYGDTASTPTVSGNTGEGSVVYEYKEAEAEETAYSTEMPSDAGDYTLRATVAETNNYEGASCTTDFSIRKAKPTVTVKTNSGLTYTGYPQDLLESVAVAHGTVLFRNDDGDYVEADDSILKKTDAGTYEIKYKVKGDPNYSDLRAASVTVTIDPLMLRGFTWPGESEFYYDGGKHGVTAEADGVIAGDKVSVELTDGEASAIGDYTAVVKGLIGDHAGNYSFDIGDASARHKWSIVRSPEDYEKEKEAREAAEKAAREAEAEAAKAKEIVAKMEAADAAITGAAGDIDFAGSTYSSLRLTSKSQSKSSINLSWTPETGAVVYVVYGSRCGTNLQKLTTVRSNSFNVTGLEKGKYYKYVVAAFDENGNRLATSKTIHVATKGGKIGNHKKITVSKSVIKKAKKLKAGKSLKLKAKAVVKSKKLKVNKHVKLRYESTNSSVATVSPSGVVKGVAPGTCYVYIYAQNGVSKAVKVTVK